jgi:hypothetical protein
MVALTVAVPAAFAATPQSCWGTVTMQRAVNFGDVGTHSSAQSEPRLGLGNVARLFLGPDGKVYQLGSLLASIDGLAETSCP